MYCNQCGAIISDESKFCNNCGKECTDLTNQQKQNISKIQKVDFNSNKKSKFNTKGCGVVCIAIIIIIVAFFICASFMSSNGNSNSQSASNQNDSSSDNPMINSESEDYNSTTENAEGISINEITIVDGFECKIKEVNWYSVSDFDDKDLIQHEDGYEYIVIVLSEKNTTDETENAPCAFILAADGKECTNLTVLSLYKNQYKINFGATMANTTAEAYTIYKIPKGSESFKMQILSNGFGTNSEYIVFDRDDIN